MNKQEKIHKHVLVTETNWQRFAKYGVCGEKFDQVLARILDKVDNTQ